MASLGSRSIPLEELLFDRAWPALLFVLFLYARVVKLGQTLNSAAEQGRNALTLAADVAHQTGTVVFFGLVVVLFIVRRPTLGARSGALGAIVALAGTVALTLFAAADLVHGVFGLDPLRQSDDWRVLAVSAALALGGTAFAAVSLATLGRCFGVFPEARGLVTRGPYRFVRHPVYLGEFISGLGLLLPIFSPWTLAVFIAFIALQIWRMVNEERVLAAAFPEYAAYRKRTSRLVPGVF
jgi:protein-S-isoprenylcysteine O-methyltransferase Ste14